MEKVIKLIRCKLVIFVLGMTFVMVSCGKTEKSNSEQTSNKETTVIEKTTENITEETTEQIIE